MGQARRSSKWAMAVGRLRGGRQEVAPGNPDCSGLPVRCSCPARAAARGGRAPCTPGPGRCPWEPQFDALTCQAPGAHAYGQM